MKVDGTTDTLKLSGSLSTSGDSLGVVEIDNSLKNFQAKLGFDDPNQLTLDAAGDGSRGGTVRLHGSVPIQDLGELISQGQQQGWQSLLNRPLTGLVSIQDLRISQQLAGKTSLAATATSDISLGGTLQRPTIGGTVTMKNGDFIINALPASASGAETPLIDPRFAVKVSLAGTSRVRSSTADIYLLGSGSLDGTLRHPKVESSLYLDRGTIRLPAALVRLDQGGTVSFSYNSSTVGTTTTSNVDLEGRTSVVAGKTGDTGVQRYDVTLGIRGDLLQNDGLTINASSDPPDLSQDQILAMLGQGNAFQNMSQSSAVQNVLGFVAPSILDPVTSELAKSLSLDYLDVEYNSTDQASIAFGKLLGSGFSLEGVRQISEPPPGFAQRYDLRIVYRPRRFFGSFSRLRFFFGADQDRPWKLGLEYGIRF